MHNFSFFINEVRKNYNSEELLQSEITHYLNKVNKIIPKSVQNVIYLTQKYNLTSATDIDRIKNASKGDFVQIAKDYQMPVEEVESLKKMLKELKSQIKLLPQYLSPQEKKAIELGKLALDDLTIDLETPAGRNAAAKIYAPLIYKIVNQYMGKSKLSRSELISAGMEGFVEAMNNWKSKSKNDDKLVSFKTFAAYRVQQKILDEINKHSYNLSGGYFQVYNKYGSAVLDTVSYNSPDITLDKIEELGGFEDSYDVTQLKSNEKKEWDDLYKLIESNFKQRDCDIFYRYFGINGYKREKTKDIAKSLGMSIGNIRNTSINKILLFLKQNKRANDILRDIQRIYNESLISELIDLNKESIIEALQNDDMFILLEDLTKWQDKTLFINALQSALLKMSKSDKKVILKLLSSDFTHLDNNYKINKKLIILFLNNLYPTENISRKTDVAILEYMEELQEYYNKYKLSASFFE